MTSPAETGRLLEQRVAEFFRANGYEANCNEVIEGRSGGRHEIDVLAEKSDALTTYRVAIECKAWQKPIEKDVVSKLHYVLGDLGLHKGIVVSLAGSRAGAERTATDLGVELWGPDELRRHLGDAALADLNVPAASSSAHWGYRFSASEAAAQKAVRNSGKGRLNLRTLEEPLWFARLWLPAYCMTLTVAQPETKRLRTRLRSSTIHNVYEAIGGGYLGVARWQWEEVHTSTGAALRPLIRDTKVQSSLRKALSGYQRVTTEAAVQRHAANLRRAGLPLPIESMTVDSTSSVYLPYFVGILGATTGQRAVAVDGRTGGVSDTVTNLLTANLAVVREQLR